jgi:uncharacterized protein (TIGR02145 family)
MCVFRLGLCAGVLLSLSLLSLPSYAQTGEFADARDGKRYKSVKMPDGRTWMAENLNYKPSKGGSWCYGGKESNCAKYGRLYDWATAKSACPAGYHLPSYKEWESFAKALKMEKSPDDSHTWSGASKLKAKSGWNVDEDGNGNGTDAYGFSALPGGSRCGSRGIKEGDCDEWKGDVGESGHWWSSGMNDEGGVSSLDISWDEVRLATSMSNYGSEFGYSVRCVGGALKP